MFIRQKKANGMKILAFTFLELLVALAIVSILAVSSIFTTRFILLNNRLKGAADTFAQQVRLARSEAIQRQQSVYLNFQSGSSWCYGSNATTSCNCSPSNTCNLGLISSSNYPGVTTTAAGFSSSNISFDSVRGLPSSAFAVNFTISDKTVTVNVNSLGQIALCATNVTGYPAC